MTPQVVRSTARQRRRTELCEQGASRRVGGPTRGRKTLPAEHAHVAARQVRSPCAPRQELRLGSSGGGSRTAGRGTPSVSHGTTRSVHPMQKRSPEVRARRLRLPKREPPTTPSRKGRSREREDSEMKGRPCGQRKDHRQPLGSSAGHQAQGLWCGWPRRERLNSK